MRTIIVGDIHGCYREFITLLKKARYHSRTDRLILLGDLVDRGPMSYEMVRWVIRWKKKHPDNFFLIRGNHEQMWIDQPRDLDTKLIWRVVGKGATIRSFRKHKDRAQNYIPWFLDSMQLYHIDDSFRCVHAAVEHEDLEENDVDRLVHDHGYARKNIYAGKITIIGHTPLPRPTHYDGTGGEGIPLPYHEKMHLPARGTICIDTGCVFGDKLTAMIIKDGYYYLEYTDSKVCVKNRVHPYVDWIRTFCSLPLLRRFCSDSEIR